MCSLEHWITWLAFATVGLAQEFYISGQKDTFGGVRAYRGEFNHMTAVGWTNAEGTVKYSCGGVLIRPTFVITAAHCTANGENVVPDTVRLGDTNLNSTEDDDQAQQISITRIVRHPQYKWSQRYHDIALLELEEAAEITGSVCPACLWLSDNVPRESMASVGFGATEFGGSLSTTLQKIELTVLRRESCSREVRPSQRQMPNGLTNDQFCASNYGMDTCEGDSGGPIQVDRFNEYGQIVPLIVGLVSFGKPCGLGSVGVYAKLSSYVKWIENVTESSLSYDACFERNNCPERKQGQPDEFYVPRPSYRYEILRNNNMPDGPLHCSGSLIHPQYLITAASCVASSEGSPQFVRATSTSERIAINRTIVHPNYVKGDLNYDIALLLLDLPLDGSQLIVSHLTHIIDNEMLDKPQYYLAQSANDGPESVQPSRFHYIRSYSYFPCSPNATVETAAYCAINYLAVEPLSCELDYGGPVVRRLRNSTTDVIVGIVSTRNRSCMSQMFLMTDITKHLAWIIHAVNDIRERLLFSS